MPDKTPEKNAQFIEAECLKVARRAVGQSAVLASRKSGITFENSWWSAVRQAPCGLMLLKASLERRCPCLTDLPTMKSAAKSLVCSCATGYRRAAYFSAMIFSTYATAIFSAG